MLTKQFLENRKLPAIMSVQVAAARCAGAYKMSEAREINVKQIIATSKTAAKLSGKL